MKAQQTRVTRDLKESISWTFEAHNASYPGFNKAGLTSDNCDYTLVKENGRAHISVHDLRNDHDTGTARRYLSGKEMAIEAWRAFELIAQRQRTAYSGIFSRLKGIREASGRPDQPPE